DAVLLRDPAGVLQLDEEPPPGAEPDGAQLDAQQVIGVVLDGVPEGLACVLEGNLVVQPRASQLRKADGEIEREPVVLRRPGRCLVGAAEVLEDETSEAA